MRGKDDGYVLVMVLAITAALLVLMAAFGPLSSNNLHQALRQEQDTQAYYLARSGAAAVASAIMNDARLAEDLLELSGHGELGTGEFHVTVEEMLDGSGSLRIKSTGTVKTASSSIALVMNRVDAGDMNLLFDNAIFSVSDLDISHGTTQIHGHVESAGTIEGEPFGYPESGFEIRPDSNRVFPPALFPGDIAKTNQVLDIGNSSGTISEESYYKNIRVGPDGKLEVDTGDGVNAKTLRIVVEDLECKGVLEVKGDGRLLLYVYNRAEVQTPKSLVDGHEGKLILFLADDASCQVIARGNFQGFIYGPGATVGIQSHAEVHGAIIAKNVVRIVGGTQSVHGKVFFEHFDNYEELLPYFQSQIEYVLGYWTAMPGMP